MFSPLRPDNSDEGGQLLSNCLYLLVARESALLVSPLVLQRCLQTIEACDDRSPDDQIPIAAPEGPERSLYVLRRNSRAVRGSANII
jgi:hypothetical protein